MKVSIGLPVYNGSKYIGEAIESILAQTYGDFELIISDNASTDDTEEVCRSYNDNRIRYYRSDKNRGAAWNYNRTESMANGEYFKWAAHDDKLSPDFLSKCIPHLDRNDDVVLVYTNSIIIDKEGNITGHFDQSLDASSHDPWFRFKNLILKQHPCLSFFGLIRRKALLGTARHGNYNSADRVFLAHMSLKGKLVQIPEYLFYWRKHPEQSIRMVKDRYAYALWFDPANAGKKVYPNLRLIKEYKSIIKQEEKSMRFKDRMLCRIALQRCYLKKFSKICKEILKGGYG